MSKTKEDIQKTTIKLKDIDVKLLKEAFGDENIKNIADVIPFVKGFYWQEADINSILQIVPSSFSLLDTHPQTLLTYVCKENYAPTIIELLLKLGANPMVSNKPENANNDYYDRYPIQLCKNRETFRLIASRLTREDWQKPLSYQLDVYGKISLNTTLFESALLESFRFRRDGYLVDKSFTTKYALQEFIERDLKYVGGCGNEYFVESINYTYEEMQGLLSERAAEGRDFLLHWAKLPYVLLELISVYQGWNTESLRDIAPNLLALEKLQLDEFENKIKKFHDDEVADRELIEAPRKVKELTVEVKSLRTQLSLAQAQNKELNERNKYLEDMLQKMRVTVPPGAAYPVATAGNGFTPLLQAQQQTAANTATAAEGTAPMVVAGVATSVTKTILTSSGGY